MFAMTAEAQKRKKKLCRNLMKASPRDLYADVYKKTAVSCGFLFISLFL
jgi:hypothetical protein